MEQEDKDRLERLTETKREIEKKPIKNRKETTILKGLNIAITQIESKYKNKDKKNTQ